MVVVPNIYAQCVVVCRCCKVTSNNFAVTTFHITKSECAAFDAGFVEVAQVGTCLSINDFDVAVVIYEIQFAGIIGHVAHLACVPTKFCESALLV